MLLISLFDLCLNSFTLIFPCYFACLIVVLLGSTLPVPANFTECCFSISDLGIAEPKDNARWINYFFVVFDGTTFTYYIQGGLDCHSKEKLHKFNWYRCATYKWGANNHEWWWMVHDCFFLLRRQTRTFVQDTLLIECGSHVVQTTSECSLSDWISNASWMHLRDFAPVLWAVHLWTNHSGWMLLVGVNSTLVHLIFSIFVSINRSSIDQPTTPL